jgi:hypothetical protein
MLRICRHGRAFSNFDRADAASLLLRLARRQRAATIVGRALTREQVRAEHPLAEKLKETGVWPSPTGDKKRQKAGKAKFKADKARVNIVSEKLCGTTSPSVPAYSAKACVVLTSPSPVHR